ncbi:MAG: PAS domain S-box protein [Candidatus Aureabacteria bacterium]|nr:PAS domain S-box protein [Candidatus Auribacterota bacterium]
MERRPVLKLQKIFNAMGDAIHVIDREERILFVNKSFIEWLKQLDIRQDIIGKPLLEVFPFLPESVHQEYHKVFRNKKTLITQEKTTIGHEDIITETRKIPVVESGKVMQIVTVVRNITERSLAEQAIRQSRSRLAAVVENLPFDFFLIDETGRYVMQNSRCRENWGNIIGKRPGDICPDPDILQIWQSNNKKAFSGETVKGEVAFNIRGEERFYFNIISPVYQGDVVCGIQGVNIDITEQKSAALALQESEERYRRITQSITDYIVTVRIEGGRPVETVHSPACIAVTGYTSEDFSSNPFLWFQMVHEEDREAVARYIRDFLSNKGAGPLEHRIIRKDGAIRWIRNTPVPHYDSSGLILSYDSLIQDITQRKQAEETLSERESFFSDVFSSIQDGISILDNDYTIIRVNPMIEKWYSHSMPLVGKKCYEAYHKRKEICEVCPTRQVIETEHPAYESVPMRDGEGKIIGWIDLYTFPLFDRETGELKGVIEYVRDITDRVKAERLSEIQRDLAIRLSASTNIKEAMEHLFESAFQVGEVDSGGLYLVDEESGAVDLVYSKGLSEGFLASVSHFEKNNPEYDIVKKGEPVYIRYMEGDLSKVHEAREKERLLTVACIPLKHEGRVIGSINFGSHTLKELSTSTRIALEAIAAQVGGAVVRIKIQESLAEEKELLDVTLRSIDDGVITTDIEGKIILMNDVAESLTGWTYQDAFRKPLRQVFTVFREKNGHPFEDPVSRVVKSGARIEIRESLYLKSKVIRDLVIAESVAPVKDKQGNIIGVVLVFRDITEKRKIEEELQRAQRMESIGILAGGIAHDFNNILTAVVGNIYLAKTLVSPQDEVYDVLFDAEKASLQARNLTHQLLTFSRGGVPVKKVTSILEILRESISFSLRGSNVRCEYYKKGKIWNVKVDAGQISQVISNLVINAEQAMPDGGTIKVILSNVRITKKGKRALKPGNYVKIAIKDQGIGIKEEYLSKIFDPFFTTKQKGSGLGLAITYSIIQKHNGFIKVRSEIGQGTTFTFYLPATASQLSRSKKLDKKTAVPGKGKILLVDDEEAVQRVGRRILGYLGYDVDVASEGKEAVDIYSSALKDKAPFDAVIMDLTIPGGMGGSDAVRKIKEVDPKAKVVVSSGYSQDVVLSEYKKYGFCGMISKPYDLEEMSSTLSRIIGPRK